MQYPEFMEICDSAKAVIPATNLSKERTLYTTNHLLSTWRVIGYRDKRAHGIKTGSTMRCRALPHLLRPGRGTALSSAWSWVRSGSRKTA